MVRFKSSISSRIHNNKLKSNKQQINVLPTPLNFNFTTTPYIFLAEYKPETNDSWIGGVIPSRQLSVSVAFPPIHYGQSGIEGLRAMPTLNRKVAFFRLKDHAERLNKTAKRLAIPEIPIDFFIEAIIDVTLHNLSYLPKYGEGYLYVRPVIFGSGDMLGVSPANSYVFAIFVCPVGGYLGAGESKMLVQHDLHRESPLSDIKASANYASTFIPQQKAKALGCKDVIYLDAKYNTYVEELSSSNIFAVLKNDVIVTPALGTILPGITRNSIIALLKTKGLVVEERKLALEELLEAKEIMFCGTAVGCKNIKAIHYENMDYVFYSSEICKEISPWLDNLKTGLADDPFGWVEAY